MRLWRWRGLFLVSLLLAGLGGLLCAVLVIWADGPDRVAVLALVASATVSVISQVVILARIFAFDRPGREHDSRPEQKEEDDNGDQQ